MAATSVFEREKGRRHSCERIQASIEEEVPELVPMALKTQRREDAKTTQRSSQTSIKEIVALREQHLDRLLPSQHKPQIAQIDADRTEFICIHLRDLR